MESTKTDLFEFLRLYPWVGVAFFLLSVIFLNKVYEAYYSRHVLVRRMSMAAKDAGVSESLWSGMTGLERQVVFDVWLRCRSLGVLFRMHEDIKVPYLGRDGDLVPGYFWGGSEGRGAELCVAVVVENTGWLDVLLHESSHMEQWAEGSLEWSGTMMDGGDSYELMSRWVDGVDYPDGVLDEIFRRCLELELDCEKRTVARMVCYGMSERVGDYVRRANSHLWSYCMIREKRRWYFNSPYQMEQVWSRMPKEFMALERYMTMDWETSTYFTRFCFLDRKEGVEC